MSDPNRTQMGSPLSFDPNRTQLGNPLADPNRTIMGTGPSLSVTTTIKPVQCPVCKTPNPPGMMWCKDCGLIFEKALDGDAFGAPAVQLPVVVDPSGREHQLRPGENVIGRQGDILTEDTRVSRRHCAIAIETAGVVAYDLGSTNGTQVNGTKLAPGERKPLAHGDKVSLGGYEFVVSLPGETNKTVAAVSGRTVTIASAPTTSTAVAWLVLPDEEKPLEIRTYSFGRRSENDIVIADPYVSGKHGSIEVTDQGVFLTDTGSTNGTVLNDAKLNPGQKVRLTSTDVIKLGAIEIKVRYKEA